MEELNPSLYGFLHPIENEKLNLILFDLDHTLIKPKEERVFSKDSDDWEWSFPNVNQILKKKYSGKNNYICIISNQKSLKKKEKEWNDFQEKIKKVLNELKKEDLNVSILVSVEDDYYRKPLTGMFDYLEEYLKKNKNTIKKSNSFYCGDAAGRIYSDKKKDFDISDLFFSKNIGLEFYVPEVIFKDDDVSRTHLYTQSVSKDEKNPEFKLPKRKYLICDKEVDEIQNSLPHLKMDQICVVLITGPPASGKSYLGKMMGEKYGCDILESDKVKDKSKMKKKMEEKINNYKSVIIIGTYPKKEDREELIKDLDKKIFKLCIVMDTSKELINHMNYFRVESSQNKISRIPEVAYRVYNKNYSEPTESEGYTKVTKYTPCFKFENKKLEEQFMYYYPQKNI